MKTKILKINSKKPEKDKIEKASWFIKEGKLVAFPTETVYGLGANAFDESAVKKIFDAKGRPADNPLIVHVANSSDVLRLAENVPEKALLLINKFWPGPLTIVLKKNKNIPDIVTAGLDTVAVRMPKSLIALELIRASGTPIAAPSANLSGKPSTTSAKHVIDDLYGKVDLIIDGGDCDIGLESSVIDLSVKKPRLLRPGAITLEMLQEIIGKVECSFEAKNNPKSPGIKHRHYKPNAFVILVTSNNQEISRRRIRELEKEYKLKDKKVEVITENNKEILAKNLFKRMRECDKRQIDVIIIEGVNEKNLGLAIMNRLKKAASLIIKL